MRDETSQLRRPTYGKQVSDVLDRLDFLVVDAFGMDFLIIQSPVRSSAAVSASS
jgi:hypothetical protein